MSESTDALPIPDPTPATDYLLGALRAAAVLGLIRVEVWNQVVREAEEFAARKMRQR